MDREAHFTFGIILLIGSYFLLDYIHLISLFGYAITLIVGSVLPDIIEPAKDYTHRDYFHSKRFLKMLYYSLPITLLIGLFFHGWLYLFFLAVGYISHLWLDLTTKMGLPD
jgi:inner membrane protein